MSTAGEYTSSFGRFSAVISDLPDHMTIKDLKIHFLHKANGGDGSPVDLSVVASFKSQRVLDNVTRRGHYYRGEEFTVEPLSDELRSKRSETSRQLGVVSGRPDEQRHQKNSQLTASHGPPSHEPPSLGAIGGHLSRNAGMAPGDSPSRGPYNIDQSSPYDSYDEESEQDPEELHIPAHRNPSRFMNIHMKKHAFDITDSLALHVYSMDILRASVDAIVCFTNQDLSKGPILNYITNTEGRVLWNEIDQYIVRRPGGALRAGEVASFPVKKFRFSHVVFVYLGEEIDVTAIHTCLVKLLKLVDQRGWESLAVPLRTYYTEDEGNELTGEDFTWALYTHLRKKYLNKEDYTLKTVHLVSKHTPKIKEIQSYLAQQIYYKF